MTSATCIYPTEYGGVLKCCGSIKTRPRKGERMKERRRKIGRMSLRNPNMVASDSFMSL